MIHVKEPLNLYVSCEFNNHYSDKDIISIGIVSDHIIPVMEDINIGGMKGQCANYGGAAKSLYLEFYDFDIDKCTDDIKSNVVRSLRYVNVKSNNIGDNAGDFYTDHHIDGCDNIKVNKAHLYYYLSQFDNYDVTFIIDDFLTWAWLIDNVDLPIMIGKIPCMLNEIISERKNVTIPVAARIDRYMLYIADENNNIVHRLNNKCTLIEKYNPMFKPTDRNSLVTVNMYKAIVLKLNNHKVWEIK